MTQAIHRTAPTIEDAREEWRSHDAQEHARRHDWLRAQARRTHHLYMLWTLTTARSSRRQFMQWLTGEDTPASRLYDLLSAGHALEAGLDFDLGISDLAMLGRALDTLSVSEIQERLETEGIESVRALVTTQRTEGEVKLPASELPQVRAAIQKVSDSETLAAPEALSLIVQAYESLPPTVQKSAIEAAKSGEVFEDAARKVVGQMLDSRNWLSQKRCAVPDCGMPSEELHHLKLEGTRFRSQEVLIPLCARHHRAGAGRDELAAHAQNQNVWIAQFWPSQEAFWQSLAALYAERLFGEESR